MKNIQQNPVKRTLVSFFLAFATALLTLLIQNVKADDSLNQQDLQAKVFPKSTYLLKK